MFGELFSCFNCDLIVVFIEIITQDVRLKIHYLLSNVILLVKYKLTIYNNEQVVNCFVYYYENLVQFIAINELYVFI